MFGYISVNQADLSKERFARYQSHYCGLCLALREGFGQKERLTLSNDMTFLAILLGSLYEPKEQQLDFHCPAHPLKKHTGVLSDAARYAADMNILLSYFKCLDNEADEKNPAGALKTALLRRAFGTVQAKYPEKCAFVKDCLDKISALERQNSLDVDGLCRLSGDMLGEIFVWKKDIWQDALRQVGQGLGQFVYLMDAFEDFDGDVKKHRFNPLKALHGQKDYTEIIGQSLTLFAADAARAFEVLPLVQDIDILRNVLYSGIWARFVRLTQKKNKELKDE